jgi:hypothetical protein
MQNVAGDTVDETYLLRKIDDAMRAPARAEHGLSRNFEAARIALQTQIDLASPNA